MTKEEHEKAILKALETPQSYSVDGETITQRSIADIIQGLKAAQKAKVTTKNAFRSLGVNKISTPGSHEK